MSLSQGSDGTFIFDAQQNTQFCHGGPFVPTLVTHGSIILQREVGCDKVMTSWEHLATQGETCLGDRNLLPCYIKEALEKESPACRKKLAGNAYAADSFFAFMTYCLSNVSLKDPVELSPGPSPNEDIPMPPTSSSSAPVAPAAP